MSDTVIIAIVAVVPTLLTLWLKYLQDKKEYQRSLNADNTANAKLDHITVLTNSTLTAAKAEIGSLKLQVADLMQVIKEGQGK